MQMKPEQLEIIKEQFKTLKDRSAFYARKFKDIDLSDVQTQEDFEKLPFSEKADLREAYPLGLQAVPDEKIKKFLMAHYQIPDYQADVCVAFAQGNVGKAIQLAASDDFNELKASALQLIKRLHDIDLYEMTEAVKQISEYKLQINDYFDLMMIWYRDVLYYKATKDVNGLIFKDEVYDIKRQAEQSSYNGIEEILQALSKAQVRLNANVNFDLVIELLLLTIKEN